jgi:hypothetical protein
MSEHPYKRFEGTTLWQVLDAALSDLVANDDVEVKTAREYIVGYPAQQLAESGVVPRP